MGMERLQLKKEDARANEKRIKAEEAARLKAQMEMFKPQQAQKVAFGVGACLLPSPAHFLRPGILERLTGSCTRLQTPRPSSASTLPPASATRAPRFAPFGCGRAHFSAQR